MSNQSSFANRERDARISSAVFVQVKARISFFSVNNIPSNHIFQSLEDIVL